MEKDKKKNILKFMVIGLMLIMALLIPEEVVAVNNTKNQLIEKDHECNKKVHSVEKGYNNLLINNIFDLYQAALVIRKYNVHKYEIDIRNNIVHVYCTMQTYTKMSIGKEILPNIKYHINGTNVIL